MDLQEIKARLAAITPGKWRALPLTTHDYNVSWGVGGEKFTIFFAQGRCNKQDAEFIANAPADIPALIKRVEDLEAAVSSAGEWISQAKIAVEPGWAGSTDHVLAIINDALEKGK